MSDILKTYMNRNVPRYTSYPTAPHFSKDFDATAYASWLHDLPPKDAISLYLHVPFCRQLCWYCGCNMKLAKRDEPIAQYARTLVQEVGLVAGHLPDRMKVSHLHWGGGTPTALVPDDLERAMQAVHQHFTVTPDAELAIESDPRTLSAEMIARIGKLGFTRASFGVQEFDPKVQKAINRIQPPDMVRRSVDGLREAGVSGINFDLIYGLPHQTVGTLLETIDLCLEMEPDRIALFGYAHVPWMARKQRLIDEAALPGPAERLLQSKAAAKALTDAGYMAIGLDHFARPSDSMALAAKTGTLRRNFQGYTTDLADTMLGLGATSIGRTPSGYVQNLSETGAWARAVESAALPVGKGVAFSMDDKLRGRVIEMIMCAGHVDLDQAGANIGAAANWYHPHIPELDQMQADGLIVRDGSRISVTDKGAPVIRVIASVFDSYLTGQPQKHAIAV
ncbi:oxygen-independent coproporphyrinogen III oxidase [Yoonia sediminilitoris]|uniref:Coproporphyrinogen-III oxidase n=1 Tax=Yoonia sediminilitoris TaxID=1286148 RepID=A0A2T6KML0_9RHOB|nr:oxygen-independent coproporphyrinogen III oxidase [Yoonia sediminilitoris]PUB17414.1 anaerobic coproporphyrinogen III oxidase [Yoonia sediminilitoris]RCW97709.1 anaerobic coproporphyrinogen III oxidase [Yoonia sediminilitoris]